MRLRLVSRPRRWRVPCARRGATRRQHLAGADQAAHASAISVPMDVAIRSG